jgi:hypothetical protein
MSRKPTRDDVTGPYRHGHYWQTGGMARPSSKPSRLEVWSYRTKRREEFHLDVFDDDRYIGHIRFRVRR